jgi:NAD(P)-dependent dehydrogenase (short-subunit alcohol dehydrogenase family)
LAREELLVAQWSGVAGKRVVITGATNGIGLAGAIELAARGAQLTLVARSEDRAAVAVARIGARAREDATIEVAFCDLSLQASVRALAAELLERHGRIDVLINNAGAIYSGRELSGDGIELTWAVNHLAPFLLTELLLERLVASAPARIVTTSSAAHRGRSLTLETADGKGSRGFRRYGETKLANILFTTELARRIEGRGVTANCFHPGLVASGFNRNNGRLANAAMVLMRPFARTPVEGARTLVWLADSDEVSAISGGYFADEQLETPSEEARDAAAARALWELSSAQVGL